LVGSTANDYVGNRGITTLSNGNYVVDSANWNGGMGAVTFGSGSSGVSGVVSSSNSLVGSTAGDSVGNYRITALSNGNYVVDSANWNGGMGAVTFGSGSSGVSGVVSSSNSLVGSTAGDYVGNYGITTLSNGNYVVRSGNWNGNKGAVTFGSGSSGVSGVVSSSNSLVGSTAGDYSKYLITALSNGNYVVDSPNWNGGIGAVTFGSGSTGVSGVVSSSNSLVGSTAGDNVGSNGITTLSNGNYVVQSGNWNGNKGAVTFGSGSSGVSGVVSSSNSLVGSTAGDNVGSNGITTLSNGNYLVGSPSFSSGAGQIWIATPGNVLFATDSAVPGTTMTFNPLGLEATLAGGTAVTLQASNDITVNTQINVAGNTGGALTLQAGRNINLNANINTANGNFTAIAGDPGAVATDLQPGTPAVTLGTGVTVNAGTGTVVLAANGGDFVNNSGSATPISAATARIYSTDLASDNVGGMSTVQSQHGCTYASGCTSGAIPSTGLSFLFSTPPTTVYIDPTTGSSTYGTAPVITYTDVNASGSVITLSNASITGSASYTSGTPTASSSAGTYSFSYLSGVSLTGPSAGNYVLAAYGTPTTWTVKPANLTITAGNGSKVYGAALPTLGATYSGFVNNDTAASLTTAPTVSTTATAASNVGSYTTSASGAADNNYNISYVGGTLAVTPAPLTITANSGSKVYGAALPTLGASYSGFVNNDTAASLTTAPTVVTNATATSNVGSYTTTASGAVDNNYNINYVGGTFAVTAATGTGTADLILRSVTNAVAQIDSTSNEVTSHAQTSAAPQFAAPHSVNGAQGSFSVFNPMSGSGVNLTMQPNPVNLTVDPID